MRQTKLGSWRGVGLSAVAASAGLWAGCQGETSGGLAPVAGSAEAVVADTLEAKGPLARPESWADCERFGGVVTPADFDPESDPFDELYMMPGSPGFLDGVPLISESKPGDQDYNGGRWHLNVLREGVDPATYAEVCTVEDLSLEDFESTANYFECPLLPRRGGQP